MAAPRPHHPAVRRRAVLIGGLLAGTGLGAGGCAAVGPGGGAAAGGAADGPEPLQDVPGYVVLPVEVEPACKQTAAAFVQAVLTAGTPLTAARTLQTRLAEIRQPVEPAAPLLGLLPQGGASAVDLVYPQYSGLSAPRADAGVIVVAEQLVLPTGADPAQVERRGLVVDVRLRLVEGVWVVVEALPGTPPPAAAVSPAVQAVLDDPRIRLPAAAEADLLSGIVPDVVARGLTQLAALFALEVQVVRTGHPGNVFSGGRDTGHADGLAVDVRALDGVPLIDRGRAPWRAAMEAALDAGATEVGGPQNFGRGTFTDEVHLDHLHLGYVEALS